MNVRFPKPITRALNRTPRLKRWLKRAYHRSRDPLDRGLMLDVGGVAVRVPARFDSPCWQNYEPTSTHAAAAWLLARPDAALLDIGCSVGLYSALVLTTSPRGRAYAFDADLVSLKATALLCRHAGRDRLCLIHGFLSDRNTSGMNADEAAKVSNLHLSSPEVVDDPEYCSYTCIDGGEHPGIPTHSLDGLFAAEPAGRPWLLKCDVEGAELLVLRGASGFVRKHRPQMLISVHQALRGFGFEAADVAAWLEGHGYEHRILAIDHEQHWWCTPLKG